MSKAIQFRNGQNEKIYPCPYFPVGSIYMSISSTNPSAYFGGVWEQIAKGKTIVGLDPNDSDFSYAGKTGGEKRHTLTTTEMPTHAGHIYGEFDNPESTDTGSSGGNYYLSIDKLLDAQLLAPYRNRMFRRVASNELGIHYHTTGGNGSHNNLQPYYTCYIWCRTG